MRIATLLAGVLLASPFLSVATGAATAEPPVAQSVLDGIRDDLRARRYAGARERIDRALAARPPGAAVRELQKMRGAILLWEDRRDDAMAAFDAAEAVEPANSGVALYRLDLAYERGDAVLAMAAVDHLIDRYPDTARTLEAARVSPLITWMRQNERGTEANDLLIRLARLGFGGDNFATRDNFAIEAAGGAASAGRMDEARELAARVNSRRELTMALTERRFSALWPALEARIGPHMAAAEAAAIRDAEAAAARHPDDPDARHGLMEAYYQAGRYADADRVGAAFATTPETMRVIDEKGGWLVNDHALVLHAMGRDADADARFAGMTVIDIARSGWLISMVINRLELLVRDRHWEQALALQDQVATLAERHGSPYARQLVRRLRLCTLNGLGRTGEAEAALAELRAHEEDSPAATIDGLICVGRFDEAEPAVLRLLQAPDNAGSAIASLQPPRGGHMTDPSVWDEGWQRLLERPAVRAAFDRVGRGLPEAFWPVRGAGE